MNRLDPERIVYHHSSGNLGSMHTINFYPNFAPIQELDDWFEHWATVGRQAALPVRVRRAAAPGTSPCTAAGTRARGNGAARRFPGSSAWRSGTRSSSATAAFRISEAEKQCLRWESKQFRAGALWHRWDYPYQIGTQAFAEQYPVHGHVHHRQLARVPHLGGLGGQLLGLRRHTGNCATALTSAAGTSRWTGSASSGRGSARTTLTAQDAEAWRRPSSVPTGSPRRRRRP